MPSRILALDSRRSRIQTTRVVLACRVRGDKDGRQLQRLISGIDHLVMLALQNPKGCVFLHDRLFSLMHADAGAGDDINQFRAIVDVVIGPSLRRKDGMAERKLLNSFLVWGEQHLYLALKWSRNFNSFFFRCLDDFQSTIPFYSSFFEGENSQTFWSDERDLHL